MRKGFGNIILGAIFATGLAAISPVHAKQEPPAAPSSGSSPTTQRSAEEILNEYQQVNERVRSIVQSPDELLDAARRAAIAAQAIPDLKRLLVLADELSTAGAAGKQFAPQLRSGVDSVLAVFNDPEATARLEALANGSDAEAAVQARCALTFAKWVRADHDAAVQNKLLDEVEALCKANPKDDSLAILLLQMGEAGPATPEIRQRARTIATTELSGEMAQQIRQQMESDSKLKELEGKPLTIAGVRHGGEAFSSDAWKGKVVLVDFSVSTWPPSRVNTAKVKKLYADFHDKGLEIVTISCDESPDDLKAYLAENPEIVWPCLFDSSAPGWHAIAKQLNVTDPSTAILIDKQGNVITVKARESLEATVARLVGE